MKILTAAILLLVLFGRVAAQPDSTGYYRSFDGVKIYYEIKGSGQPVLLVHGFTGTGTEWKTKPVFDSLVAHGFKVIIADLRGNGKSDHPATPAAYADDAEAKDMIGLLQFLRIKNYYAAGYSRGSIILARILVKDTNCVKAVMGGMGADFTNPQWPRRIAFYNALVNDSIKGFEGFRKYIADKGLDPLVLAFQQKEQPSTSHQELAALTQRVLVICGDEDSDNGKGIALQSLIPQASFVEVPGDHNHTAQTVAFANEIIRFLEK